MLDEQIFLPLLLILFCVAALVVVLWRPISKRRAKTSQWRTDFDGVSPKLTAPSAREARQVYRELQAIDKANPKVLEDVGTQALKELQQIVDEHHKKK
jgi:hypothetical protein